MRPRPDAAENVIGPGRPPVRGLASMRPRPDAAENSEPTGAQAATVLRLQ